MVPEATRPDTPLYTPLAEHLPGIYQEDPLSFAECRGYLGLADALLRQYARQLEELFAWLSPRAPRLLPPGYHPGMSKADVAERVREVLDELGRLFGFEFPDSWHPDDTESEFRKKTDFLERASRIWRRRGTPSGFVAWFCLYFDISSLDHRPVLVEHFKYRPEVGYPETGKADRYAHRATLVVPLSAGFDPYERRREVYDFIGRHAPAHILFRVCWIDPEDRSKVVADLADDALRTTLGAPGAETRECVVEALLRPYGGVIPSHDAMHLCPGPDARPGSAGTRGLDRIGTARLPNEIEIVQRDTEDDP